MGPWCPSPFQGLQRKILGLGTDVLIATKIIVGRVPPGQAIATRVHVLLTSGCLHISKRRPGASWRRVAGAVALPSRPVFRNRVLIIFAGVPLLTSAATVMIGVVPSGLAVHIRDRVLSLGVFLSARLRSARRSHSFTVGIIHLGHRQMGRSRCRSTYKHVDETSFAPALEKGTGMLGQQSLIEGLAAGVEVLASF